MITLSQLLQKEDRYGRNPKWPGPPDYFTAHAESLLRDKAAIAYYIGSVIKENTHE